LGKRRLYREYRRDVARVIELSRRGLSEGAISSSVGTSVELVSEILRHAGEVEDNAAGEALGAELGAELGGGVRS
jgi:hypothetical protein